MNYGWAFVWFLLFGGITLMVGMMISAHRYEVGTIKWCEDHGYGSVSTPNRLYCFSRENGSLIIPRYNEKK